MALKTFFPTSNDPFLVNQEDMALAKFGHINTIVAAYNTLEALVNTVTTTAGTIKADYITPYTTNGVITLRTFAITRSSSVTKSGAATLTAAELATGLVIYTGGAATLTLPLASDLATVLGAVQGTTFDFVLDNTGGSGTVTLSVTGTGIVATSVHTAGTTLTLAQSTTQGSGGLRITFLSTNKAIISRLY